MLKLSAYSENLLAYISFESVYLSYCLPCVVLIILFVSGISATLNNSKLAKSLVAYLTACWSVISALV